MNNTGLSLSISQIKKLILNYFKVNHFLSLWYEKSVGKMLAKSTDTWRESRNVVVVFSCLLRMLDGETESFRITLSSFLSSFRWIVSKTSFVFLFSSLIRRKSASIWENQFNFQKVWLVIFWPSRSGLMKRFPNYGCQLFAWLPFF